MGDVSNQRSVGHIAPTLKRIHGKGVRFKMGALFCVPGRLKSGASGLRPGDGLRGPGRRRATVGAKRLQSLSSLGQCIIRQIAPKLKRIHGKDDCCSKIGFLIL